MSLIDRIQSAAPNCSPTTGDIGMKRKARDRMYERITPQRIAHLVAANPSLARKELATTLGAILSDAAEFPTGAEGRERIHRALLDDILGFGPIEPLLLDPSVTEIMVNGASSVFFERDGLLFASDTVFDDDEQVRLVIERIIAPLGRRIDERTPLVNARLPQGHRVNAVIPPLALNGPTLTIRKFRSSIHTIAELSAMGSLSEQMAVFLRWAVIARKNIAVSGGTGSGKTTLLNALSIEIPHNERIITIEDSAELRFQTHPHVVSLEARPANLEGCGEITIRDLVVNALRMRPDRIVVGECRGGEALDMLQAMNTGHDGSLTTLHANSPDDAVSRLVTMVRYVADLPAETIRQQVRSAVQLIVHQDRFIDGTRRVTSIVETRTGPSGDDNIELFSFEQTGVDDQGRVSGEYLFRQPPSWIDELVVSGLVSRTEVDAWTGRQ